MWILMAKGQTYYVDHVSADLPWTTKETPNNVRTKGAIKFKDCNLQILEDNTAVISSLTAVDIARIRHRSKGLVRIMMSQMGLAKVMETIKFQNMWHGTVKRIGQGCGRVGYLIDIREKEMLILTLTHKEDFNIIQPNHPYFSLYDDNAARENSLEEDELDDTED
jgi:hypothetical protein